MSLNKSARINWVAFCTGFIGVLVIIGSIRLGLGKFQSPGPGLFTFIAGMLLFILSFTLLIKEFPCSVNLKGLFSKERFVTGIALIGPVLIFERLGFGVTIFLQLVVLLRMFGFKRWSAAGGIAGLAVVLSHLLFSSLLGMALPRGPWGF